MLLPSQLTTMKLGIRHDWRLSPPVSNARAGASKVPLSYGRIASTPRVAGHNDQVGDCVPTMACNAVQSLLARNGITTPIPDQLPLNIYSYVTGWTPSDPATDQGTDPEALFSWWQQNAIAGYKLKSATALNPQVEQDVQRAITQGGVSLIVNLATDQQNQIVWTPSGQPGSWGRHSIWADQYVGLFSSTSWGEEKWIDWSFFIAGFVTNAWQFDLVSAA